MGNMNCVCCRGQEQGEERVATVVLDANDEDRWRPEYIYVTVLRAVGLTSGQGGSGVPPDPFCMVRLKGGATSMVRTQTVVSTREPDWGESAKMFSFRRAFNHDHNPADAMRAQNLARVAESALYSGDISNTLSNKCVVNVRVYDEDIPSTGLMYFDVCLGGVDVDVTDLAPGETIKGWFPLLPKGSRRDKQRLQNERMRRPGRCPIGQVYLCIAAGHLARPPSRVSGIPEQARPKLTRGDMLGDSGGLEVEVLGAFGLLPFMDRMRATFNSSEGLQSVAAEMSTNVLSGLTFAQNTAADLSAGPAPKVHERALAEAQRKRAAQGSITHPYVMVEVEGVKLRTRAVREGDTLNPSWVGQTMTFDVTEVTGQVRLSVWYEDPLYYTRGMRRAGASEGEDWLVAEMTIPLRALAQQLFDGAAVRHGGSRSMGTSEVKNSRRVDDNTIEVVRWVKLIPPRPNGELHHTVQNTLCSQSLGWVQVRIRLALTQSRTFCYMVPPVQRRTKASNEVYYSFRHALTLALGLAGDVERVTLAVSGLLAPLRALEIVLRLVAGDARYLSFWLAFVFYIVMSPWWLTFLSFSPTLTCIFYLCCCRLYANYHDSLQIWSRGLELSIDDVEVRHMSEVARHRFQAVSKLLDRVPQRDLAKLHRGDIVELAISSPKEFLLEVEEDDEEEEESDEDENATRDEVVSAATMWVPEDGAAGEEGAGDPHGRQWGARRSAVVLHGPSGPHAALSREHLRRGGIVNPKVLETNPTQKLRIANRMKRTRSASRERDSRSGTDSLWICCAPRLVSSPRDSQGDVMKVTESDSEEVIQDVPVRLDEHESRMARLRKSLNRQDKLSKALGKQEDDPVFTFWLLLLRYKAYVNLITNVGEKLESLTNGADPYISTVFGMVWFLICVSFNLFLRALFALWAVTHGRYTFLILFVGGLYLIRLDELRRRARLRLIHAIVSDIEKFESEHIAYRNALHGSPDVSKGPPAEDSGRTMEDVLDTSTGTWLRRRVNAVLSAFKRKRQGRGKRPGGARRAKLFSFGEVEAGSPDADEYLAPSGRYDGSDDDSNDGYASETDEHEVIPLLGQVVRGPHLEVEAMPDVSEEERLLRERRESRGLAWGTPRLRIEDTETYFWRVMQLTPLGKMYMRLPDRHQFIEDKICIAHMLPEPPTSKDAPLHPHDKRNMRRKLTSSMRHAIEDPTMEDLYPMT